VIVFEHVTVRYADRPILSDVDLTVPEGELCLVVGGTGVGKSTLLRAVNGLVPHFTGGRLSGRVLVDGRDTRTHPPRELADVVGFVGQDPLAGFVTDTVEEELTYSMESLGLANPVMRTRVEETLDLLGIVELRDRPLTRLSGGQQQRVAIGAALTAHPRVLVLDEPTSALDPGAAEDVLAALHRLVHDLGMTVLIAEHRLERVAQYADRVIWLPGAGAPPVAGPPGPVLAEAPVAPPVVRLGQLAGWRPVPVSVRDARRQAGDLRASLAATPVAHMTVPVTGPGAGPVLRASRVAVSYGQVQALTGVDLAVATGERVALMGRNGSGKSSLLWTVQGGGRRGGGTVTIDGVDPASLKPAKRRERAALVPQQPADLLYLDSVDAECAQADLESGRPAGTCRSIVDAISPGIEAGAHPRDLSEGQRLALALGVVLCPAPPVLLLDEPTRGLDYPAKARLAAMLHGLAADGRAIVLATHDVEFAAEYASRVVVLAAGEVVADGPARAVLTASPVFAPQVAKVLAPVEVLTVAEVARLMQERS